MQITEEVQEVINMVLDNPSEENKNLYHSKVNDIEYRLLLEAEECEPKSREYFNKRTDAFSFRRNCCSSMITQWVAIYKTSEGCPCTYADTLNIPFQKISQPS